MTQFTSFVAVEESYITEAGKTRRVEVAVEMPAGVSYEGVFGSRDESRQNLARKVSAASLVAQTLAPPALFVQELEQKREDDRLFSDFRSKLDAELLLVQPNIEVAIEIWLVDATPELLTKLKELGFEQTEEPKVAKILVGKINSSKLTELANLEGIRHIKRL